MAVGTGGLFISVWRNNRHFCSSEKSEPHLPLSTLSWDKFFFLCVCCPLPLVCPLKGKGWGGFISPKSKKNKSQREKPQQTKQLRNQSTKLPFFFWILHKLFFFPANKKKTPTKFYQQNNMSQLNKQAVWWVHGPRPAFEMLGQSHLSLCSEHFLLHTCTWLQLILLACIIHHADRHPLVLL